MRTLRDRWRGNTRTRTENQAFTAGPFRISWPKTVKKTQSMMKGHPSDVIQMVKQILFCYRTRRFNITFTNHANSVEQSPSSEADSRSIGKQIFHPSWNQNFYLRVYKSPPLYPIFGYTNPHHILKPNLCTFLFNIILQSIVIYFKLSLVFRFSG
jgi:hypothetical protein